MHTQLRTEVRDIKFKTLTSIFERDIPYFGNEAAPQTQEAIHTSQRSGNNIKKESMIGSSYWRDRTHIFTVGTCLYFMYYYKDIKN